MVAFDESPEKTKAPHAGPSIWCIFQLVSVQSAYPSDLSICEST